MYYYGAFNSFLEDTPSPNLLKHVLLIQIYIKIIGKVARKFDKLNNKINVLTV